MIELINSSEHACAEYQVGDDEGMDILRAKNVAHLDNGDECEQPKHCGLYPAAEDQHERKQAEQHCRNEGTDGKILHVCDLALPRKAFLSCGIKSAAGTAERFVKVPCRTFWCGPCIP